MQMLMSSTAILAIAIASSSADVQPRISVEPLMLSDEALSSPIASPPPQPIQDIAPRTTVLIDAPVTTGEDAPLNDADLAALVPDKKVAASLPPQPLGQFAETVLGQILGVPYIMGPGVAQRRDLVSMSGPQEMSSRQFLRLAETALNQYGLVLVQQGGAVLVREAPAKTGAQQLKTGVTKVVALGNIAADPAAGIVADIVEGQSGVAVQSLPDANGVMLQGDEAAVAAASGLLAGIDQPQYAGARVARIAPMLWSSDALAEKLREVLASEGFSIGSAGSGGTNLVHLSRPDCLLLFSDDVRLFNRVLYWVEQLDSLEGSGGDHAGFFVYQVRNTTAAELGSLVGRANGGDDVSTIASPQGRIEDSARRSESGQRASGMERSGLPQANTASEDSGGKIIVDNPGNRILFRGTRREYAPLLRLLKELDVAPKQVLVEITIAEVALTDETRFGMEWFLDRQLSNGSVQANTTGGLAREAGGLGLTFAKGFSQTSVTAALNAIATNQNLNIISTPRLLARSGGEAQILIGNDVPIITSQRAADIQSNGDTDILQTVQYRQTGVILNIRPVVLSNDRIDIEIFQEVSSQQPNLTSAIGSPVISNRSVTTRLSLREGMTAVLGGMIQDSNSMGQRGVPLLKDIPLLGRAFRVDSATKRKTELLILVTPKVISEDRTMQNIASEFGKSINGLMNGRGQKAFTLAPWMPGQTMPLHSYSRFENPK